jgi:hypothetical protein
VLKNKLATIHLLFSPPLYDGKRGFFYPALTGSKIHYLKIERKTKKIGGETARKSLMVSFTLCTM